VLIQRVAHAAIRVLDLDEAQRFYEQVLGLIEIGSGADGRVFLAGGKTAGYDLALLPGGVGLDHFAFTVASVDELGQAERRLRQAGVEVRDAGPEEFRADAAIRFAIPSGHEMELVVVTEPAVYVAPLDRGERHFSGIGPVSIDHVTLLAPALEPVVSFLTAQLGFRLTESVQPEPGNALNAFLRSRDQHHDLAFFLNDRERGPELNHVAFRIGSFDEIRRACDLVAALGYGLDASPGRHEQGNNLFVYFKDPSGNRVELSGDMAVIDGAAPPRILKESRFDTWRDGVAPQVLSGT
jgi:catechol 2,3-dioxygenase